MRFTTMLLCDIASTLVAATQVTKLKNAALAIGHVDPSTSYAIVCPPGAGGHCDQQTHAVPQTNATAAKDAREKHKGYHQSGHEPHKPRVAPIVASPDAFNPKTATIMVCSGTYYTDTCDHPTITEGVCKHMTVGSLVGGPPIAGGAKGMSSMWLGDKVDNCVLSCGLNCEDINRVGGLQVWGNIEDMTIGLLKPLNDMILSYKCSMS